MDRKKIESFNVPRQPKSGTIMNTSSYCGFMSSDEDSRDSGVCDMEIDERPTTFPMMDVVGHFQSLQNMTMDEEAESMCKNLMNESQENRQPFKAINRIFDESPKSRTLFTRPGLAVRDNNKFTRKRTFAGFDNTTKKMKISEEYANEQPSTSKLQFSNSKSIVIQRTHSSSVLERSSRVDVDLPTTKYTLNTVSTVCSNAYRRIIPQTLKNILSLRSFTEKYMLIDCRYPYEYNGGHVKHAINIYDPADIEAVFYDENGQKKETRIPIFYCEYSQKRGPSMAYALRRLDRQKNELAYPYCDYQEMYVLDKGYRNFYYSSRNSCTETFCEPDNYIEMDDSRFSGELKKWNFHKKSAIGTSVRVVESKTRVMFRQLSVSNVSSTSTNRSSSRRPLFSSLSSPTGLSTVLEVRTPSPPLTRPLTNPIFS